MEDAKAKQMLSDDDEGGAEALRRDAESEADPNQTISLAELDSQIRGRRTDASVVTPIIRSGKADDAGLLSALGARTFAETFAPDNTPENMAAYLASAFSPQQQTAHLADPRCLYQIAEANGVALGYAMLRSGDVLQGVTGNKPIELVRLYVSRESLGSGVGAALMQACIDEARQRGFETLWLGVWEHNTRAQAFYRKWNFHDVGTHVFQLGDDPQTDILMQLSISE